jgi:hypothetical protein
MTPNQIKSKERAIGKQAAKMAEAYIHQVLRQKLNIRNQGDEKNKAILDATKVKSKMGQHRLLGLNFTSSKVGFILHYGYNGVRYGGDVYLQAARYVQNRTNRSDHNMKLPARQLFDNIYTRSGALTYILTALEETRTEAVISKLNNLIVQLNNEDK